MLVIRDLSLTLKDFALKDINLSVEKGDYCVIVGRTGSGKTLLLETIAGRYQSHTGKVNWQGESLNHLLAEARNIGFVYQHFELFEHMTVFENIAFPLKIRRINQQTIQHKVSEISDLLGVHHLLNGAMQTLSGGEKQRVALGRALIFEPAIILLDEPTSALDYVTKLDIRKLLQKIHQRYQPIIIHVTHDISEALALATKIGVMQNGRLSSVNPVTQEFKQNGEALLYEALTQNSESII